jgi:hypothetical protein
MTDEIRQALKRLRPETPRAMLAKLQELRAREERGEVVAMPLITLHLQSGVEVSGWFLAMENSGHDQCMLLHLAHRAPEKFSSDVLYLELSKIEGIAIHHTPESLYLLSSDTIASPPGKPAPTALEMKRKARDCQERLSRAIGQSIIFEMNIETAGEKDEELRIFSQMLDDVLAVMLELIQDPYNRQTIRESLEKIAIEPALERNFRREGKSLYLKLPLSPEGSGRMTRQELRQSIEEIF